MDKAEKKAVKQIPLKFAIATLLFLFSVALFFFLSQLVSARPKNDFDESVFAFFSEHTTPALADVMLVMTFFGSTSFLLPAYILLVSYLLTRKKINWALDILIVGLSGELMKHLLKSSFARPRPDLPLIETLQSFSFPSGHALSSFIFCSSVIYLLWNGSYKNTWRWILSILLILFSLAIGLSRIILRFHYASDVIAGYCIGFAWVMLCLWSLDYYRKKMQTNKE